MTSSIPAEARRLHEEGRAAGSAGDPVRALTLFQQAQDLAPGWPYPAYDAAFTYLLAGDVVQAERCYAAVDAMAPRGFFTAKTALHTIRREIAGELPEGFAQSYAMLEWAEPDAKRAVLTQITSSFAEFAPAWKDLAVLLDGDDEKLSAFDRGLAAHPDPTTRGVILVNKALILDRRGERDAAQRILREILNDTESTLEAEAFAKQILAGWSEAG